jgi:2-dehydro-3-deoxyphosphogluconate aldolase/(4S)-4-hydroxy-2-oxoglutarate aldolase
MNLAQVIPQLKWMPIIVADSPGQAVEDATSYRDAGFPVVEILCRTPAAIDSIRETTRQVKELFVGAGTVLTIEMAERAVESGAQFLVSPGTDPVIMDFARRHNLQFVPGVHTATDVAIALRHGHMLQKFFPAGPAGGLDYIDGLASPFTHTGVRFIAGHGINKKNYVEYLRHPLVCAIIGDWLPGLRGQDLRDELAELPKLLKAV